jgi:hypothetical protein
MPLGLEAKCFMGGRPGEGQWSFRGAGHGPGQTFADSYRRFRFWVWLSFEGGVWCAGDYVEAMWLMLQREKPEDLVIATGETHSVRELVETAFSVAGLDWNEYVEIDERFVRPAEVDLLIGDPDKAHRVLGWKPRVDFRRLVERMVTTDLERLGAV